MTQVADVKQLIDAMAANLRLCLNKQRPDQQRLDEILMVGVHTGGVWVAEQLHAALGLQQPLGILDISFYRDDFSRIGMNPQVRPSKLPVSVDGQNIVLVDDILHTGRTVRAAMNELFDYGRPASILLVVLVERSGRELPIQADVVGMHITLKANQHVKLLGPDQLRLTVSDI